MKRNERRLLLLGLDSAGKTSVLMWMMARKRTTTVPTVGFSVQTVRVGSLTMNIWDVGGHAKHRPFWRHYYTGTEGLIFVVDASDSQRIEEASEELRTALSDNQLVAAAILILATKSDKPEARCP